MDNLLLLVSPERGPAMPLEDCESKLVEVFIWKVVEAAFCKRLRAGVSAVTIMLAEYTSMRSRGVISLPPEPESSCLDGLDPRDWDVLVRPLPVACAGFVGIVQESIWAVGKGDPRQIDSPRCKRNPNVSGSDGNGIQERAGLLDDQEIRKSPKHSRRLVEKRLPVHVGRKAREMAD